MNSVNANANVLSTTGKVQGVEFDLHTESSPLRLSLETYIAKQYEAVYGAQLKAFLPILINMKLSGLSQAVLGLRPACCQQLFLEHYVDTPIEQKLAQALKQPIARDQMVEIGNLVASRKGASQPLFVVMTAALAQANYKWMLFTATPEVEKLIQRLDYSPILLADALPEKLGEQADDWGSYYRRKPHVMAADVANAMVALTANRSAKYLIDHYRTEISSLAQCLRDHRRVCGG